MRFPPQSMDNEPPMGVAYVFVRSCPVKIPITKRDGDPTVAQQVLKVLYPTQDPDRVTMVEKCGNWNCETFKFDGEPADPQWTPVHISFIEEKGLYRSLPIEVRYRPPSAPCTTLSLTGRRTRS